MRTDELRRALHDLSDDQPPADRCAGRAAVARRHRRHQQVRGLAAVACVVAVALLGLSLTIGGDEQGLDVGGDDGAAPGMLVPDLSSVPVDDVTARVLGDDDGRPLPRVWLWSTEGDLPAERPLATEDLTRPFVLLSVRRQPAGPGPGDQGPTHVDVGAGREALAQSWAGAQATVLAQGVPTADLRSLLDALPGAGFDGSALVAPAGLSLHLSGDPALEPMPGVLVPLTASSPAHQLRVRRTDGDTLWLASGDPQLVLTNVLLMDPGGQITSGAIHAHGALVVDAGAAGSAGARTLLWIESGRGYALALTAPDGRSRTSDELFAAAEALRPVGPPEWQGLVRRTSASGRSVDTMIATVEGQGTPIDPATGETLP